MGNHQLEELKRKIQAGGAVLFVGSGFSSEARAYNEDLPTASRLAELIGKAGGFEHFEDLRYAADFYLSENSPSGLISLLHKTFSVDSWEPHHTNIASAPWRRIYTTNYDLCVERSAQSNGKAIIPVDISQPPANFQGMQNVCVHINGSLNNLTPDSLEREFKLSTSSYLSPAGFAESQWHYVFRKDLDFASAIVFVGYSLYDIDIQKILNQSPELRAKTYFVTQNPIDPRKAFTFSKFGTPLAIGTEGLGELLGSAADASDDSQDTPLASLWQYSVDQSASPVRDSDVSNLFLFGQVSDDLLDGALTGERGAPILVRRTAMQQAKEMAKAGTHLVITGEFGNGKTLFLRMLRSSLALDGHAVYVASEANPHQHDDLEKLTRAGQKVFVVVDSYDSNLELIKSFSAIDPSNITLLLAARTSTHERNRSLFSTLGVKLAEFSVDDLDSIEIDGLIDVFDNAGFWGDKAGRSPGDKFSVIVNEHKRQFSLALLGVLHAPQIVERVKGLVAHLLADPKKKDTIFAIAVLSFLDLQLTSSLVAEIAMNDEIYSSDLRNDPAFQQMFALRGSQIRTKSSPFALALISHQFNPTYVVDQLLRIVSKIGDGWGEVKEKKEIQKSLLRFSVVERMLPEKQRKTNLVRYYDSVKRQVQWLGTDPHFWLQYGMTQLTYKDYDTAQKFFKQAYSLAERKSGYHTTHIDTQQARLHLMRALEVPDIADAQKLFGDANKLLRSTPNDVHRYRQVELYSGIYTQLYPRFNGTGKAYFEQACRAMIVDAKILLADHALASSGTKLPERVLGELERVIASAKSSRGS